MPFVERAVSWKLYVYFQHYRNSLFENSLKLIVMFIARFWPLNRPLLDNRTQRQTLLNFYQLSVNMFSIKCPNKAFYDDTIFQVNDFKETRTKPEFKIDTGDLWHRFLSIDGNLIYHYMKTMKGKFCGLHEVQWFHTTK